MACTVHTARSDFTNNSLFLLLFSSALTCFFLAFTTSSAHPLSASPRHSPLSLPLQDFPRIPALVAGHPALQAVQSHDAADRQEEPS